jgi:hypothetical protein
MSTTAIVLAKSKQFIKNINLPSCNNCIYYIAKTSKCSKFGEKDIISGKITYEKATYTRYTENMCGIIGNYYEKQ